MAALVDDEWVAAHRRRALDPDRPVLRGSAQNPDVFFQAREALNPFVDAVPGIVEGAFARLAERTGRRYGLVEYTGAPDAERVVVLMGSGIGAAVEAVDALVAAGEKVGVLQVRLYRPFPADAIVAALPESVRAVAVLDRTKEPGAPGEPLRLDVVAALADAASRGVRPLPRVVGGRYGLSSKEFTPAMVRAVLDSLQSSRATRRLHRRDRRRRHPHEPAGRPLVHDRPGRAAGGVLRTRQRRHGRREQADGQDRRRAHRSPRAGLLRLRLEEVGFDDGVAPPLLRRADPLHVSHPRRGLRGVSPVRSPRPRRRARRRRTRRNVPAEQPVPGRRGTWDHLPREVQESILEKGLDVHVIDAHRVARDAGLAGQINVGDAGVLLRAHEPDAAGRRARRHPCLGPQTCTASEAVRSSTPTSPRSTRRRPALSPLVIPAAVTATRGRRSPVPPDASDFVQRVTARMLAGEGDLLPVSALPVDGTFPTGTARVEKRTLAAEIPIWDPEICIDCARCALVCPHAAIRMKIHDPATADDVADADAVPSKRFRSHDHPGLLLTIQVAPDDCTGCGVCVDVCPAKSKSETKHKAIDMEPIAEHLERERARFDAFLHLEGVPDGLLDPASVKGSQAREPLFEFSGACAGCGETPYLKLLTQLFGDRALVANATGCSSIYGGNLPTTPWGTDAAGRGPAWSNSLFEDNAEFGLGMRIALDRQSATARRIVTELGPSLGDGPGGGRARGRPGGARRRCHDRGATVPDRRARRLPRPARRRRRRRDRPAGPGARTR